MALNLKIKKSKDREGKFESNLASMLGCVEYDGF